MKGCVIRSNVRCISDGWKEMMVVVNGVEGDGDELVKVKKYGRNVFLVSLTKHLTTLTPECLMSSFKWKHNFKFCNFIELDQLLEDAPLPFIMQHAAKLSNVRKRVSSLNSLLRSVQHRLDNIDRVISIGSLDNKSNIGGSK